MVVVWHLMVSHGSLMAVAWQSIDNAITIHPHGIPWQCREIHGSPIELFMGADGKVYSPGNYCVHKFETQGGCFENWRSNLASSVFGKLALKV